MNDAADNPASIRPEDRDVASFDSHHVTPWLVLGIPFIAAVAAGPALQGQLLGESYQLIHSSTVAEPAELVRLLTSGAPDAAGGGVYRPATAASIALDALLWGTQPCGFHITNLLLHVLASLLCFLFVRALIPPRPEVALTAALLFAAHPVHGDAIFWISARPDLLCTAAFIGSLLLFMRGRGEGRRRRPTVASLGLFALALLSKEAALTLPLLLIALDLAHPSAAPFRRRFRQHLPRYLAYIAVAVAYLALRHFALHNLQRPAAPPPGELAFNVGLYAKLLLLPVKTRTGVRGGVVLILALLVLVITFLKYARMGDRRSMGLGFVWTTAALLPSLPAVREADLYLPSVGFCIFVGVAVAGLVWRRDSAHPLWISRASAAGLVLLILGSTGLLYHHATIYREASELASDVLRQLSTRLGRAPPTDRLTVANLPSALTSAVGDQPIFAFGFREAVALTIGRREPAPVVLSRVYVAAGKRPQLGATRRPDGSLELTAEGAGSFSFHTAKLTTGRDTPEEGQQIEVGPHVVRVDAVEQGHIRRLRVRPGAPLDETLWWDGRRLRRLGEE